MNSRTDASGDWTPGTTVLGEFVVERHLGDGAFGRVDLVRAQLSGHRYAVKRVLLNDPADRSNFLAEAERWIALPGHENIVACHFVRTSGDDVAVFSEFIPGGSLASQIASSEFLAGVPDPLYYIIDIAVQVAWGLDAVHSQGLLHLDVKPENILLTESGVAKIADFGLASPRTRSPEATAQMEAILEYITEPLAGPGSPKGEAKELVRSLLFAPKPDETIEGRGAGGTTAYVSLEQAEGRPVGRGSDAWSWGLVILEMFAGGRFWSSGTMAGPALDRVARGNRPMQVPIPGAVCDLLRRCFADDPTARPRSLMDAAAELAAALEQAGSRALRRQAPPRPSPADSSPPYDRLLPSEARWDDPRAWLTFAYQTAGLDPEDAVQFWPKATHSARAMALADLAALLEARRVLIGAADRGIAISRREMARLHTMIATVRRGTGDLAAAIEGYRQAGATVNPDDDVERRDFVIILLSLSIALRENGLNGDAIATADQAVMAARGLPDEPDSHSLLGSVLQAKANIVREFPEKAGLLALAVAEYEQSGDDGGLIKGLAGQAAAFDFAGRAEEAAAVWERHDRMLDRLLAAGPYEDLRLAKGISLYNRGVAAGITPTAMRYTREAVSALTDLVERRGHYQAVGYLAGALFHLATVCEAQGQTQDAVDTYRAATQAFEQAVIRDGRSDLTDQLARAYDHESMLVSSLGNTDQAMNLAQNAVSMWTRIADRDGSADIQHRQAEAHSKLAGLLREAGNLPSARQHASQALAYLEQTAANEPLGATYVIMAHMEMAAVERAEGNPTAAIRRLKAALDILDEVPANLERVPLKLERAMVLTRLGNVLGDVQEYEQAIAAYTEAVDHAREISAVKANARTERVRLEAAHGQVNALFKFGDYAAAITAAGEALRDYGTLIAGGRADLHEERARLQGALAQSRMFTGDVSGAVAAWQQASHWFSQPPGAKVEVAGQPMAAMAQMMAREASALLSVTPAEVPARTEELRREHDEATQAWHSGQFSDTSSLFESALAKGMALCGVHANDPLLELCGLIGIQAGVTAMGAGRYAAAIRAFGIAEQCGKTRYKAHGKLDGVDRWCNARTGLAMVHLMRGDERAATGVIHETEVTLADLAPKGAKKRIARMKQQIDHVRQELADSPRSSGARRRP